MIVALLGLAIVVAINIAFWELHWALGLTMSLVSVGSFYVAVMDSLGRRLNGHRRDCICRPCRPAGHQDGA